MCQITLNMTDKDRLLLKMYILENYDYSSPIVGHLPLKTSQFVQCPCRKSSQLKHGIPINGHEPFSALMYTCSALMWSHMTQPYTGKQTKTDNTHTKTPKGPNVWVFFLKTVKNLTRFLTISINLILPHGFLTGVYFILTLIPISAIICLFLCTYLWQTWSGHSQSGPFLRSGRSPRGRQGWKCQNLMQERMSWLVTLQQFNYHEHNIQIKHNFGPEVQVMVNQSNQKKNQETLKMKRILFYTVLTKET